MVLLKDMDQTQVIAWIQSLPEDGSFSKKLKKDIVDGIKKYVEDEGSEVTGLDLFQAEDEEDVQELLGQIAKTKARKFYRKISEKKEKDMQQKMKDKGVTITNNDSSGSSDTFTLNVLAKQGTIVPLEGVDKNWIVSAVKAKFLEEQGNQTVADKYRMNKWDDSAGKIELKKSGKSMIDNKTLEYYNICSARDAAMPLVVSFKVIGGAEAKYNDIDDDEKYRTRKLRKKKIKQANIKYSSKADCIMGYNDSDGIKRAAMPCGCAIAADTMFRYMKSLFEKDYKSAKLYCPTPENNCGGNAKQREWDWGLVFIVADLTDKEIAKYTKIINYRLSGEKSCPHCGANTERPKDLRICRVKCTQCNNRDWCWNCEKVWNASGLGPICGHSNCMGAQLNKILAQCDWVQPPKDWWNRKESGTVPRIRACPKCLTTLEYTQKCKHMECLCCPHQFCFNCLGEWNPKDKSTHGSNQCNHGVYCKMAPIQKFT